MPNSTRIGIMGGTFDPVHNGHLVIAEISRAEFGLDRVIWVPAGDPPHKTANPVTLAEHRYAMTLLATATHPQFEVTRLEMERTGRSYTLDTIRDFHERHPGAELFFITGADAILEILTWYRHEELIRACDFIAATRPGYDLDRLRAVLPPDYLPHIHPIATPGVDISSTDVRARVRAGKPIRYLTPEPVEAYITKHGLYAAPVL